MEFGKFSDPLVAGLARSAPKSYGQKEQIKVKQAIDLELKN